jgi:hypothetical protein
MTLPTPRRSSRRFGWSAPVAAAALVLATAACAGDDADTEPLSASAVSLPEQSGAATPAGTPTSSHDPTPAVDQASSGGPTSSDDGPTPSASPSGTGEARFAAAAGLGSERFVDADAEIDVPDQSGDGRSVRIEEIALTRGPGHVAIFTASGELLGSAAVSPSVRPVSVPLTTAVPASGELIAVLLSDDGNGRLDLGVDAAVTEGGDEPWELEDEDFDYRLR